MKKLSALLLSCILLPLQSWAVLQTCAEEKVECIEVGRWDIGLAFGYGSRSNPLKDFDDIPIYLAPTFAYYGDSWYFDTGNVGYTLIEEEKYTVNLTTSFSSDSAFFHRWDPSNIFVTSTNAFKSRVFPRSLSASETLDGKEPNLVSELERRDFTYLGGAEAFIYTRAGIINIALAHDMLNVHQGTEAQLKWLYNIAVRKWKFELSLAFDWKSEEVVDYYYGVRASETEYWNRAYKGRSTKNISHQRQQISQSQSHFQAQFQSQSQSQSQSQVYKAKSTINIGLEFTSQYVLTKHWDLIFLARYTHFGDEIVASPLLDEDYSATFFIGTAYRF